MQKFAYICVCVNLCACAHVKRTKQGDSNGKLAQPWMILISGRDFSHLISGRLYFWPTLWWTESSQDFVTYLQRYNLQCDRMPPTRNAYFLVKIGDLRKCTNKRVLWFVDGFVCQRISLNSDWLFATWPARNHMHLDYYMSSAFRMSHDDVIMFVLAMFNEWFVNS